MRFVAAKARRFLSASPEAVYFAPPQIKKVAINEWKPILSTRDSLGMPYKFSSEIDKFRSQKLLKTQIELSRTNAVIYRECIHDVIQMVEEQVKGDVCKNTIFIEGKRGYGKSTSMFHIVGHFIKKEWIVIYFPDLTTWTDGSEPFEMGKEPEIFYQPRLSGYLLERILEMNRKSFMKMKSPNDDGELIDYITTGILKNPCETFESLIKYLASPETTRPSLLIALDSVNAIYAKTRYHNIHSEELTADQFHIPRVFHGLLSNVDVNNGAVVLAQDHTQLLIKSPYIDKLVDSIESVNKIDPQLVRKTKEYFPKLTEFSTILPVKLDPSSHDLFCKRPKLLQPRNPIKVVIPPLDSTEVENMLLFYQACQIVTREDIDDNFVMRQYMLSQGNPSQLMRLSALGEGGQGKKSE